MAVEVQIGSDPNQNLGAQQVLPEAPQPVMEIELQARRTIDGDVMVYDHADIDIVIMPLKRELLILDL